MQLRISFLLLPLLFALYACDAGAQKSHEEGPIHWMSLQEALSKQKSSPKKIFIDMYTDWCGWCKRLDATTFKDSAVAAYMNSHFYPVKMDAETKDTIVFKGTTYHFKPEYKSNELAAYLLSGQMSYPTAVYLDEELNVITQVPGFMTGEQLLPILRFFAEDIYKSKTWEEYSRGK
ncbi:MAG: hypothetical protein RL213_1119 [Bacteroidota bacterium]|jgi:thioredoxin-related protein